MQNTNNKNENLKDIVSKSKTTIKQQDIKSKKYQGVYYRVLQDESKTFYITYKEPLTNKFKRLKIGNSKQGFNETYANNKRSEILSILRLGNDTNIPILQKKSQKQTLNDIAKLYFKNLSNRATQNGLRETISKYNKHIKDNLGNYALISITKEQGLNLQNELKKNGYANATINTTIGLIKTIFNFAVKEQIHNINPFKQINNLKTDNKRLRFLSIDEIKELKKAVKSDEVIYLFVCLSLSIGARLQSVLNIQNKDINYDENYINIYDFKNKSYYIGALTSEIKSILLSKELKQDDYIISYTKGAKCEPKRIQRRLKSVFDKLFNKGLDKNDTINRVVIHTLRHTFASQLALNKTSLFTIQKLLNHKDIKQTMRYAKLTKDNGLNEVLKIFDEI